MTTDLSDFGDKYTKRIFVREVTNEEGAIANPTGLILNSDTTMGINIGTTFTLTAGSDIEISNTGIFDVEASGNIFIETTGASTDLSLISSGAGSTITLNAQDNVDFISGTDITLTSTDVKVSSNDIILNSVGAPTDVNASGGGIIIKGDTDHSILFQDSTDTFDVTDDININNATGTLYVNGQTILDRNNIYLNTSLFDGAVYFNQATPGLGVTGDWRMRTDTGDMVMQYYNGASWVTKMNLAP